MPTPSGLAATIGLLLTLTLPHLAEGDELPLEAAFTHGDITPNLEPDTPVWLAGYLPGRRATGIHDRLYARCVLLRHGTQKIALISLDLIGLQYPAVRQIREQLGDFAYVLVSSTHNHEGPDVIGVWGKTLFHRGVDESYVATVVDQTVQCVRRAEKQLQPSTVHFGLAEDESLLDDRRLPQVKDGILRVLVFSQPASGERLGIVLQWNCHPETLGSRNTLITADYPAALIDALSRRWQCPAVFLAGSLGGLMAPPAGRILDPDGRPLETGDFAYARGYGEAVAELTNRAIDNSAAIRLSPFVVSARPILIPVENIWYRGARAIGVLRRPGRLWTGDFERPGPLATADQADEVTGVETEVGYLRLGELHVACIPGEIYPELVYGRIQDPADPGADFPDAPPEPHVSAILPGEKWMLFGLANDEIGYIIPKRQWDNRPPYAYGRATAQYGEINSCGPDAAPIVMQALANRVRDAQATAETGAPADRAAGGHEIQQTP